MRPGVIFLEGSPPLLFTDPIRSLTARSIDEVAPVLRSLASELEAGRAVAGFMTYDAGAAFGLPTRESDGLPLCWFGVYERWESDWTCPSSDLAAPPEVHPRPGITEPEYLDTVEAVRRWIAAGDTYQVNLTFKLRFEADIDPWQYFLWLRSVHPVPHAAYVDTGEHQILSLSPELFLSVQDGVVRTKPMKGTRPRGVALSDDRRQAEALLGDPKELAENLMIVDLMRNDLGRVCEYGSVHVESLFDVEKYATVHQLTSQICGQLRTNVTPAELFAATFPPGSVTGAPKRRTMELIQDLEPEARGMYTGTIGCFLPGPLPRCQEADNQNPLPRLRGRFRVGARSESPPLFSGGSLGKGEGWVGVQCRFNVAIRTLTHQAGRWEMGVGGGITWDSKPENEFEETRLKATFLSARPREFEIFETMIRGATGRVRFLEDHLDRMAESAEYWGYPFDRAAALRLLEMEKGAVIRLAVSAHGELSIDCRPMPKPQRRVRAALTNLRVQCADRMLRHKTTERALHDEARRVAEELGCWEGLLVNEMGNVTEGSITNLFYLLDGQWCTPPEVDGLLPGIWRARMAPRLGAVERSLPVAELNLCERILLGNSVRGAVEVGEIVGVDGSPLFRRAAIAREAVSFPS